MISRTLVLIILFFQPVVCLAQTTGSSKWKFRSHSQVGVVAGQSLPELHVQTVNGIKKNVYFIGLGAALDYYHTRTVEVFADVKRDFYQSTNTPYVYADIGINIPWVKNKVTSNWWSTIHDSYNTGGYFDLGMGYRFSLWKKERFLISAGYNAKTFFKKVGGKE